MAGYNRLVMIGNLTRDPDYKQLSSGQAVCRLGLATNRQFKNRQTGSMVQEVCYVDVDVWGPQAESCRQYLQKGRSILIEGRLKFDTWEDQQGQTRSKHSIVADRVLFLSSAGAVEEEMPVRDQKIDAAPQLNPENPKEKDILDKIEKMRAKAESKMSMSENSFRDEPPFQDDLPF